MARNEIQKTLAQRMLAEAIRMEPETITRTLMVTDWGAIKRMTQAGYAEQALYQLRKMTDDERFVALSHSESMASLVACGKGADMMEIINAMPHVYVERLQAQAEGLLQDGPARAPAVFDLFKARCP
jgi:hypothetical protein